MRKGNIKLTKNMQCNTELSPSGFFNLMLYTLIIGVRVYNSREKASISPTLTSNSYNG